jgi:hypothetical protein
MPIQAVDEHELANRPEDWFDRLLFYFALVVQKRDVRGEIRIHKMPQTASRHRGAKGSPKQLQPAQSIVAEQDERMIVRPAPEARDAVEPNIERWHAYLLCSLACHPNDMLTRAASVIEKKQRDVQTIRQNEIAVELTGVFHHLRQAKDACRRIRIRESREKKADPT